MQNNLLRKCGLLAHTSAAFLKNCCTEKLSVACGLLLGNDASRETDLPHPAKGGSTSAFACQRAAIAPLPCPNLQLVSQRQSNCELASFKECNCSRENLLQNNLLRKCGLLAHTSAAFLKNCCTEKLSVACGLLLGNDASRETDLPHPAKGGSTSAFACQRAAIAPLPCPNLQLVSQRQSNCELASFKECNCSRENLLQNNLLRKCGLLAHTSAAFLKNCCTEKLSVACGLLLGNDASRETDLPHPAKGGSTPAFACQRAAIASLPCPNLQLVSQRQSNCELESFKKCNCCRGNLLQNLICFANVGCSPTPRQHF